MSSSWDRLPVEIIKEIVEKLCLKDLATLSTLSRFFNVITTPFLYSHMVLCLGRLVGPNLSEKQTQTLRGLENNSQGRCQYVRRLTVRSCSLHKPRELSDADTSSLNATLNALLGSALRHMVNLRHLEWLLDICPTEDTLAAIVGCNITTLNLNLDLISSKLEERPDRNLSMVTRNSTVLNTLTSLTILGVDRVGAEQHIADLVCHAGKKQLRSLKFPSQNVYQESPDIRLTLQQLLDTVIRSSSPLSLEELELFIAMDTDISSWLRAFNFGSIKDFTVRCQPGDTRILDFFWAELQRRDVSFKHLTVTYASEELGQYLKSTSELETLIFNCPYWNPTDISCISGHFHCLRSLFLPRIRYSTRPLPIRDIRKIVRSCPNLEEFGLVPDHKNLFESWKIFARSPALRRVYYVIIRKRIRRLETDTFISDFVSHFQRPGYKCPFFDRLEILSYHETLWRMTELSEEGKNAMHFALDPESALMKKQREQKGYFLRGKLKTPPLKEEYSYYNFLGYHDGYKKIPLKACWADFRSDKFAMEVRDFVGTRKWDHAGFSDPADEVWR